MEDLFNVFSMENLSIDALLEGLPSSLRYLNVIFYGRPSSNLLLLRIFKGLHRLVTSLVLIDEHHKDPLYSKELSRE